MSPRPRLDQELVRRGLAPSRARAAELISAGRVEVAGVLAAKPSTRVALAAAVRVRPEPTGQEYVSRGGHKLAGALAQFAPRGLRVRGAQALDAGASTGGFTDVLLRAGASHVVAVDVGYGQLAWVLRRDERVTVLDRTNVRDLSVETLPYRPALVVADLAFISLTLALPPLVAAAASQPDFLVLVKPQFEVGRSALGRGGVVREPELRVDAVLRVAAAAGDCGLGCAGVCASPLPGPAGNVEFFLWLRRDAPAVAADLVRRVVGSATGERLDP